MPYVDLSFRVLGSKLSVDHGYALYSAISRLIPEVHDAKEIGIHPVRGLYSGNGELCLTARSRLVVRLPDDKISAYIKLGGKALDVNGRRLRVGVPEVRALRPIVTLYARLVTIKGFMEPGAFLEAARRQLSESGIGADLHLGDRRTLRVKDKQVVGFEVMATGLSAGDSIKLQETGIGGRRRMGCGVFVTYQGTKNA